MADGVFNIARGKVNEYVSRVDANDPTNSAIVVVLLRVTEADAVLEDYDDLGALLGAAGNTEADFTNYARKVLTDADVTAPTPDDTNNRQDADLPDQTWTAAGGTLDNNLVKMIVCYDNDSTGGTDANLVPLTYHDFVVTTDGNDLTSQFPNGIYRASA